MEGHRWAHRKPRPISDTASPCCKPLALFMDYYDPLKDFTVDPFVGEGHLLCLCEGHHVETWAGRAGN
jgi:hypothetical protein